MLETPEQIELIKRDGLILSAKQKQTFQRDGYLILHDFIATNICQLLMSQAAYLVNNYDTNEIKTIFSTLDPHHSKNDYFLESGDKIRCFFEEGAIGENGELKADRLYCINKIGHALHDLDPVFNCFSHSHKNATLARDLGIIDPLLIQSMYVFKQPYIGGEVIPHQDASFLFVKNQPITGFWYALEDATIENGCLWAIPGGHKDMLKSRSLLDKHNHLATEIYDDKPWSQAQMIPLEVPQGSLIVLHGLLPHMSKENLSSRSRQAYTLHIMSGRDEFAADNWLKRPKEMPFKGFL